MAIVCMVNYTDLSFQTERQTDTNWSECSLTSTNPSEWKHKDGPFVWDRMMQGHILSIFYLPYGITHIPSSILINRFGARQVFGLITVIAAFVTFLIPLVATYSFLLVVIIRGILGLFMNVVKITYPGFTMVII
ncbi:hypothetical protein KUTeg_012418 [Tegillarca granosa]|uniref:Major facilitator superfamily (MFS) profile domain-containing protein n=1 Tax=Tegillarca granosa TaxID=220873 RepID=A0ABQ9EZH6_TEGGR|nr:hypothetical protein KUTeg_012418 [Tegillarca granosa]